MNNQVKALQDCLFEMVLDIDALCKLNNITYFVVEGNAIGAIRHKGFIPWDDDMDIAM